MSSLLARILGTIVFPLMVCRAAAAIAEQPAAAPAAAPAETPAQRGYRLLLEKPYLSPDFDQQVFDELWKTWEEPLRSKAEKATPDERRQMAYSRYGLIERPGDLEHRPLQYVVDEKGNWTMNCLACHQGKVAGQTYPGLPNSLYALETLTEEVAAAKDRLHKKHTRMEKGSALMPLGTTNGTTNAVMFGVALLALRDPDLNLRPGFPHLANHDHDAPAWWNFHRRRSLYSDGFAKKSHRALMQFLLDPENKAARFREWENDFKDVYAWLDSLNPPKYPWLVDSAIVTKGHELFDEHCARCHGKAGREERYPNKIIPIETVGTDPVRLAALTPEQRRAYGLSWFGEYGKQPLVENPGGYVAPPLDGIWASAPYFHNGSVPTLWHVLHPDERPKVWLRSENGYDQKRVGLEVETFDTLPAAARASHKERHRYFDTTQEGKSAAGHNFPGMLDEDEKRELLEYLKTI
jgi:mono/diheme cytochrome c family protein